MTISNPYKKRLTFRQLQKDNFRIQEIVYQAIRGTVAPLIKGNDKYPLTKVDIIVVKYFWDNGNKVLNENRIQKYLKEMNGLFTFSNINDYLYLMYSLGMMEPVYGPRLPSKKLGWQLTEGMMELLGKENSTDLPF